MNASTPIPPDEEIEALIVKLERLTIRRKDGRATPAPRVVYEGAAALRSLSARNRVMRAAIEPFVQALAEIDDGVAPDMRAEDTMNIETAMFEYQQPTVGDLRRLRTALSEQTKPVETKP